MRFSAFCLLSRSEICRFVKIFSCIDRCIEIFTTNHYGDDEWFFYCEENILPFISCISKKKRIKNRVKIVGLFSFLGINDVFYRTSIFAKIVQGQGAHPSCIFSL